jgi:hypothetical protein
MYGYVSSIQQRNSRYFHYLPMYKCNVPGPSDITVIVIKSEVLGYHFVLCSVKQDRYNETCVVYKDLLLHKISRLYLNWKTGEWKCRGAEVKWPLVVILFLRICTKVSELVLMYEQDTGDIPFITAWSVVRNPFLCFQMLDYMNW